jgi:hypothetical protein
LLWLCLLTCAPRAFAAAADDDDDNRYAQDEYGDQPFHDHGYEDLADAASGKGAFDVMLTTYTLFERVGASNRCAAGATCGAIGRASATAAAASQTAALCVVVFVDV